MQKYNFFRANPSLGEILFPLIDGKRFAVAAKVDDEEINCFLLYKNHLPRRFLLLLSFFGTCLVDAE